MRDMSHSDKEKEVRRITYASHPDKEKEQRESEICLSHCRI